MRAILFLKGLQIINLHARLFMKE